MIQLQDGFTCVYRRAETSPVRDVEDPVDKFRKTVPGGARG